MAKLDMNSIITFIKTAASFAVYTATILITKNASVATALYQ